MLLIPAIDLKAGRCVRLYQGDFAAETVYSDDPLVILERYRGFGAELVHVVDLDGAKDGEQGNQSAVQALLRAGIALQIGGGLRTLERVQRLLDQGADRVVIGSVAINQPDDVLRWMKVIDPRRVVLALDVRIDTEGTPLLTTHGWQQTASITPWSLIERFQDAGLTHVLCTDVARDGALVGPNVALYAEAVRRFPRIQWQASGGVAQARDLWALRECGAAAAISGKALLENKIPVEELRPFLPNASSPA
jgi:phosphoribosylformimino-5-aminoimidazole carboxamide ribotide isomerase